MSKNWQLVARPWRRVLIGLCAALVLASVVPAGPASAAPEGCDYADAGTGPLAATICWLDLSSYDAAQAASAAGQPMTVALPGELMMTFTVNAFGSGVRAASVPTIPSAFLGRAGHYSGVAGQPAFNKSGSGSAKVALTNIRVVDRDQVPVSSFVLVSADAARTNAGESITWTSDQPLRSLTPDTADGGLGNACDGGLVGLDTTGVRCDAITSSSKSGTAILGVQSPATLSQKLVGRGSQAIALGLLVAKVQLTKTVVDGYAGDAFRIAIADPDGATVGSADTGGSPSATTGEISVLTGLDPTDFTMSETATAGSLSNYQRSWACTLDGSAVNDLPAGDAGASAPVAVVAGDQIACAITNTAIPSSLGLTKVAGPPVDVNGDGLTDAGDTIAYGFTVQNTGQLPVEDIAVTDDKVGSVTCAAATLAAGATTSCAADAAYVVTDADAAAGNVHNSATVSGNPVGATATVVSAPAVTDTPAAAAAPRLTLTKSAAALDVNENFRIDLGDQISWSFRVVNAGNVPLQGITVTDPTAGPVTCLATTLLPGARTTCTADLGHVIGQPDVDAGFVTNTATASAGTLSGVPVQSNASSTDTPISRL